MSKSRIIVVLGVLSFFGMVVAVATDFQLIDNTLGVKKLLQYAFLIGLSIGLLVAFLTATDLNGSVDKIRHFLLLIFFFVVFTPMVALKTNKWFANQHSETKVFAFVSQKPVLSKAFGQLKYENIKPTYYLITLEYQGETIRLKSDKPMANNALAGKEVYLQVVKGLWGFEIVDSKGLLPDANKR
jgi:uncharacterized membrane protein